MLRNFAYGGLALFGGAVTGIAVSSWAMPTSPPQVAPEVVRVASIAQPAMTVAATSSSDAPEANDCSPWDVSDIAMEAALEEMIRRGWRPPSQAEIVAAFDTYDGPTVQPVEPEALVPVRRVYSPPAADDPAQAEERFPLEQTLPIPEVAPAPPQTPAGGQPQSQPLPEIVIGEPETPSN
jgi:hypothetical protein